MPAAGDTVGHYEILRPLGKGGMGEVFLAQDTVLDRKVALKFLPAELEQDASMRQRFNAEAKAVASLDHPFICDIFEIGAEGGRAYFVMEFVEGETLEDLMARGPIPTDLALHTAEQIAQALEVAHQKGIVHRDLKPPNIMLTRQGHPKVMDFGIAKKVLEGKPGDDKTVTGGLTQVGSAIGTINYMSPEQARGEEVDARSDIFAFGVLLHEMLSGVHPFKRVSGIETISAILRDAPPELEIEGRRKAPGQLAGVLKRCLAKDAADRYPSMGELIQDLRHVRQEMSGGRKSTRLMIVVAAVAVLATAALALTWLTRSPAPSGPVAAREPLTVLVSDFDNRTGDEAFDGALEQAMVIGLEDASFISSYKRGAALQVVQQIQGQPDSPTGSGPGALNTEAALLVARREGIEVIVAGFVEGDGGGFRVGVDALDAATGQSIKSESARAGSKSDVLGAVGKLAVRTRKALGDNPPEAAELSAETFTAGNLDAARAYSKGQDRQAVGQWTEAIDQYSLAVQLDPRFGRAYAGLAASYANDGKADLAKENYEKALSLIDRMTDREKFRTRGGYYLMVRNFTKAQEEYARLVEQYPADGTGLSNLAFAHCLGHNMAQALEFGRRAVEANPDNLPSKANLATYALYAGDYETVLAQTAPVLQAVPTYVSAYVLQALAHLAQGRATEAAEIYQQMRSKSTRGASIAATGLADLAMYQGKLEAAVGILNDGIAGDEATDNPDGAARKRIMLAQAQFELGQSAAALVTAREAASASEEPRVLYEAGQLLARAGKSDLAREQVEALGKRLEPDRQIHARLIEGEIQLQAGKPQEALSAFQDAQRIGDTWLVRFALGRAYLEAGAFTEAYSEFETCLKRGGEATEVFIDDLPTYRLFPPVHYYLGRAQAGLNSPSAADSFKAFLAIKEGGTETAQVADARARLAAQP